MNILSISKISALNTDRFNWIQLDFLQNPSNRHAFSPQSSSSLSGRGPPEGQEPRAGGVGSTGGRSWIPRGAGSSGGRGWVHGECVALHQPGPPDPARPGPGEKRLQPSEPTDFRSSLRTSQNESG